MSLLPTDRPPAPSREEEALIREAKRRQRRRRLAICAAIIVLAGLIASLASLPGSAKRHHHTAIRQPKPARRTTPRPPTPDTIPRTVATTLLLWPAGSAVFSQHGGPPGYSDDLATDQLTQTSEPAVGAGDYQPLLVRTGNWIVYVGNGATAMRASLTGRPRVIAANSFFVPAAQPGRVWLWGSTIRLASAAGGPLGRPIMLPLGSQPIAGTDAGLLLTTDSGLLELWQPGSPPRSLPGSADSGLALGFGVTPRLVAYGSRCTAVGISANAPNGANSGYDSCRTLRVLDVVTGQLASFPAPRGTSGWVPYQFDTVDPVAPGNAMIAAEAELPSRYNDQGRLYVVSLTRPHGRPRLVPGSAGFVLSKVAWSVRGGWLFFQGPTGYLRAFQPATGKVRGSHVPCCQYTVMTAIPSAPR